MSDLYANVIIDISQNSLDRVFQYLVPTKLKEEMRVGVPVLVPFGAANKARKAYVVELTHTPSYELNKIKSITEILSKDLLITDYLVQLAAWLKDEYGGTFIQALRTVMPIKKSVKHKEKRLLTLILEKELAERKLKQYVVRRQTAKARLLKELLAAAPTPLPYELVTGKLAVSAATIKSLEKDGVLSLSVETLYRNPLKLQKSTLNSVVLNEEQKQIVSAFITAQENGDQKPFLIHGITGSGKTEVYMALISYMISKGRQAIVLIPEIALTYQTVMRFYQRFADRVSIINSRLSAGERYDQFERAKNGELDIMIGPRSALFTPFANLGIIVIDEEHENSYISESTPRYHSIETAIERGRMQNAAVVLGSATPSVGSYYQAKQGNYHLHTMTARAKEGSMLAQTEVIDLREELASGNKSIISRRLNDLMEETLKKKEQIMLFLNRRGYAGFVSCRACGLAMKCPHCDVSLTAHRGGFLTCHYCGYKIASPKHCPKCGSPYIAGFGTGTQKVEALMLQMFPQAKILRMDLDTTSKKGGHEKILQSFANEEADILIGTQMIVKGHDFPKVTLVGVLAADLSLNSSDYQGSERTFSLLTQAAGRAGRGDRSGRVVIQTYSPGHYCIKTAARQDYETFYAEEMSYRRLLNYPPVYSMLTVWMSSPDAKRLEEIAKKLAANITKEDKDGKIQLIGPADAAVSKIKDVFRKCIYIKHPQRSKLISIKNALESFIKTELKDHDIYIQFDLF